MSEKRLLAATRIVRNSIGLFVLAAMAKGSGLIVAIIVARHLGVEALGFYAVLIAITMILELVAPMGQQDVLIRSVAREQSTMLRLWVESTVIAVVVASLCGLALAVGGRIAGVAPDVQLAVDVVALSLPFGSSNFVAQSVLQGLERLKFLTIATFLARIAMLVVLVVLLLFDVGVVAAFIGRMTFHVLTLAMLVMVIVGRARFIGAPRDWNLTPRHLGARMAAALPFAGQRVLNEASVRGSVLVLPFLMSMQSVGIFDAADRIRQTIATMVPIVTLAIMPAFSRTFRDNRAKGAVLATYSMKFLLIGILPVAFLVAASAPAIIRLLYGSGYEASAPVLQTVIWAQVFLAVDMILKQAMIASDNELSMLRRSATGLLVQIALTVTLVPVFGVQGVAIAIVCTSALVVSLNAHFVRRHVVTLDVARAVFKPLLCAVGAGTVALALRGSNLLLIAAAAAVTYLVALFVLRTFSADELMLMRRIPGQLLKKGG